MSLNSLQDLVDEIKRAFGEGQGGKQIAALLGDYASRLEDWRPWALGEPGQYTRNLVELCDEFELLLLHWGVGQASPVHNHEGQDCWMAVLDGTVEEVHYEFPGGGGANGNDDPCGPLACRPTRTFQRGDVAYISDEIALHQVRATTKSHGVSLHLYAKPYSQCNCYCEHTGAITRVDLGYHSIRGVLCTSNS